MKQNYYVNCLALAIIELHTTSMVHLMPLYYHYQPQLSNSYNFDYTLLTKVD